MGRLSPPLRNPLSFLKKSIDLLREDLSPRFKSLVRPPPPPKGVRSAEYGVRSAECGKCGVWKVRSVENAECGKHIKEKDIKIHTCITNFVLLGKSILY